MDQQSVKASHPGNESNDEAQEKTVSWSHVFDWGFWSTHPVAIISLSIGGLLLAPITNFPGGNPKTLWFVAAGFWVILGMIILWVFSGIIARMEGRELLTTSEVAAREKAYRDGIQSQFDSLKSVIGDTRQQIEAQKPRRLTAHQKQVLKERLSPFAGQSATILCALGDSEAMTFAADIASVLNSAGWKTSGFTGSTAPPEVNSVGVAMNPEPNKEKIAAPMLALAQALGELELTKTPNVYGNTTAVGKEDVGLTIAGKPVPEPAQAGSK